MSTVNDQTENRTSGVTFGPLLDDLESASFPMTKEELLASYGEYEIDFEGDSSTVGEVLEPKGEETYQSPEDVKRGILDMVGSEAVGREDYTDRGGEPVGDDDEESL